MKHFIQLIETTTTLVEVEADDVDEAVDVAYNMWEEGKAASYGDVSLSAVPCDKFGRSIGEERELL